MSALLLTTTRYTWERMFMASWGNLLNCAKRILFQLKPERWESQKFFLLRECSAWLAKIARKKGFRTKAVERSVNVSYATTPPSHVRCTVTAKHGVNFILCVSRYNIFASSSNEDGHRSVRHIPMRKANYCAMRGHIKRGVPSLHP